MKHTNKPMILFAAAAFAVVVFSLALLPVLLVSLYPHSESKPAAPDGPAPVQADQTPEKRLLSQKVTLYRHQLGQVVQLDFEDYVKGVVAGEMPSTFEPEALKAQAVAARTYALSKIVRSGTGGNPPLHPNAPLCDDTHCQVYRSPEELKKLKGDAWMKDGWVKISQAVDATAGQVMYYQGKLVEQPLFHSSSGGKTENSEDVFVSAVPYLRSVDSPYEQDAPHQADQKSFSLKEFTAKLKKADPGKALGTINEHTVRILSHSAGGQVEQVKLGNLTLDGTKVRSLFGLSSANFTIRVENGQVVFTTTGSGHGVGMSQYGANGMAKAGYGYVDILRHYYSGVEVK